MADNPSADSIRADNPFADLVKEKTSAMETTALGTAARSAAETGITMPGVLVGAGAGAEVGSAFGPIGSVVGGVIGGAAAGIIQSYGLGALESLSDKEFGTNIQATKQAQAKEHPYAELFGGVTGVVVAPGQALGLANPYLTVAGRLVGRGEQMAVGAGAMAAIGGTQRAIEGSNPFEPASILADVSAGAFIKPSKLGKKFVSVGERFAGGKTKTIEPLKVEETPVKPEDTEAFLRKWQVENDKQAATPSPEAQKVAVEADSKTEFLNNPPKDYHPKDAIEAKYWAEQQLKKSTDEDARASLQILISKADEVIAGDQHSSIRSESGITITRRGNYIDVVEVPKDLQKKGLGTKIVSNLESDMKKEGYKSAFLLAKEDSIPFWEKQGYSVDPSHVPEKGENTPMSKKLGETSKGPLAKVSKDGTISLDHAAIEQDFREGFKYIFDPSTPTGAQKAEVFKSLGITKEYFAKVITTPEEYKAFLKAHEESHVANNDKTSYPRTEDGKLDLMHPAAIDIEARATSDALAAVKAAKPEPAKIPLPESITTTEDFHTKGQQVLKDHGPEAAKKFAEDVAKYNKEHNAPVPTNVQEAASSFHELGTKDSADANEFMKLHQDMEKEGVTSEMREKFYSEWEKRGKGNLTLEEQVLFDKHFKPLVEKHKALYERNVALGRAPSEDMHPDFASRQRIWDPNKTAIQTLWERLTRQEGAFAEKVGGDPTSIEKRNLFVIERAGGKRTVIQKVGTDVFGWTKGKREKLASNIKDLSEFATGKETIKEATVDELHQHTPYRYSKDAVAVVLGKLAEMRKFDRAANFLDSWKQSPMWGEVATQDINVAKENGWQTPKYIDKVPQLAGYFFEPKTKYVIEDFAKSWDNSLYMKLTSALIKNMMLNPLPHIMNEVMHLFVARGASSWVNPKAYARFADTGWKAMQDVWNQSPLYIEVMREGGSMMSGDMRTNAFHDALIDKAAREAFPEVSNIAKKAGLKPVELYQAMLRASNKIMWMSRDAMYLQMVREFKVRNPKMTTREAIAKVEQHMPNYQIKTTVAGSRKLSELLQNPNVVVFSKYHYGLVNSMMNVVKEMNPKNLSTPKGRVEFRQGLDSALAYAMGMAILYPVADEIAKKMFGDESMEQRRAGPFHIIEAVKNVSRGKADTQAILSPLFTFNPMLLTTAQFVFNRKLYSGRHVYESDDTAGMIAKDVGKYLAHSIPQAGAIMDVSKQDTTTGATKAWVAKQIDIKSKAPAAQKTEKRAKAILERNRQVRLRKYLQEQAR